MTPQTTIAIACSVRRRLAAVARGKGEHEGPIGPACRWAFVLGRSILATDRAPAPPEPGPQTTIALPTSWVSGWPPGLAARAIGLGLPLLELHYPGPVDLFCPGS